jgi:Protein of unknown function (DUF3047)
MSFRTLSLLLFFAMLQLTGCASKVPTIVEANEALAARISPWVRSAKVEPKAVVWEHFKLPGKKPSQFDYVLEESRDAITANAQSSASMLRQVMRVKPGDLGAVKFSWKLPDLIQYADMSLREFDDSPVRVVLAFDGDRSKFSAKNAMLSELAHVLSGWCNICAPESIIVNPHTDRIRKLPLESGPEKLNRWMNYERNVRADFVKAFGEEPGVLTSISIMTDTDNTKSVARAWYGPIALIPGKP